MSKTTVIKNLSSNEVTYAGQVIAPSEEYTLQMGESQKFSKDSTLFNDVASGMAAISNGDEFLTPIEGWNWLTGSLSDVKVLQASDSQGNKVAVHASSKPMVPNKSFYATWVGAGDDPDTGAIAEGDMLVFDIPESQDNTTVSKIVKFHPSNGEVYLYDGYIKWQGAGVGDYCTVEVIAEASQLQTMANLDLIVENNWVKYAGPGMGTHGFGGMPVLVPRAFSRDGDWDFSTATGLVPNFEGNGSFKISDIERTVHTFVNKMPLLGDSANYLELNSEESTFLPPGFYIKVHVHNASPGNVQATVLMYIYRQQTTITQ
jgi:hypothetical protein